MKCITMLAVVLAVLVGLCLANGEISCTSCGSECQAACGTRHFRACCFNFQRKRRTSFVSNENIASYSDSEKSGFNQDPSLDTAPLVKFGQDATDGEEAASNMAAEKMNEPLQKIVYSKTGGKDLARLYLKYGNMPALFATFPYYWRSLQQL